MMFFFIALVCLFALFFYFAGYKPVRYWKDRGVIQSNGKWFVGDFGDLISRKKSFAEYSQSMYEKFANRRYFGLYEGPSPVLMIRDPELLKQITVKDFEHFTDHKPFVHEDADPLWSKNLFASRGQKWRDLRSILSPAYTSSKMKSMYHLMVECSDNFVKFLSQKEQDVIEVKMKDLFSRFANDVIATTAFGIQVDSLASPNNKFYLTGKAATDLSGFRRNLSFFINFMCPKLRHVKYFSIRMFNITVVDFFSKIINETLKYREEKGISRPDIIQLLMEARRGQQQVEEDTNEIDEGFATAKESEIGKAKSGLKLTNMDIAAQAMLFFFGGFDTVSTLMTFMSYELAVHQDIQERLRNEINNTLEECNGSLTYEALMQMKYMDMVVSEALRKWPSMVQIDRYCTKPYVIHAVTPEENTVFIEKGTALYLPFYAIHRDPQYYPDPEKFDPERFSDENKGNIKPYTYLPFGTGPRNCIGSRYALLEVKLLFFHILANFEIIPVAKTQIPIQISKTTFSLATEDGMLLGLKRFVRKGPISSAFANT